ncbi:MAG: hypothetical protein QOC92_2909 [Acidimicrobiaceae bacterium]|jgi:hypothetical protein
MSVSTRTLAATVAAMIIFDTIWVRAPFLAILALPFIITAWRYRDGRTSTRIALGLWCALYVLIAVTYAIGNGMNSPKEPNQATETISVGDFVGVYLAGLVAAWLGVQVFSGLRRRDRVAQRMVSA